MEGAGTIKNGIQKNGENPALSCILISPLIVY
jgi:hypothetical protein